MREETGARERLFDALDNLQCGCSVQERMSGHRIDCGMPEVRDAQDAYLEAIRAALRTASAREPVAWMVEVYIPEQGGWVPGGDEPFFGDEEEAGKVARAYRAKPHSIPARVIPLYADAPAPSSEEEK